MSKISTFLRSPWFLAIIALVVLRLLFLYLAVNDMPFTGAVADKEVWWIHHGGDEVSYFQSAKALLNWEFVPKSQPLGFSIILAPIVFILDAEDVANIAKIVVILHSIIFYTLAVILVYWLVMEVLGKKKVALTLSGVFLIYPYFFYYFFYIFSNGSEVIMDFMIGRFKQLMFFTMYSDPLSMLVVLFSLILLIKLIKRKDSYKLQRLLLLGVITSFAVIIRMQNAMLLPFYAIVIVYFLKFRSAFYFIAGAFPFILFQLYANFMSNRAILKSAYGLKKGPNMSISMISIEYPLRIFTYPLEYSPLLFLPMALALLTLLAGMYNIVKQSKDIGLILSGYLIVNVGFIMFLEPTFRNPRYFLNVIPAVLILVYFGLLFFYEFIKNARHKQKI